MLRRRIVDNSIEETILTGLITSDKFCRDVANLVRKDFFVVPHAQIISKWCMNYFKQYRKAPFGHIKDIFENEKSKLKEEDADLIKIFLTKLSDKYESEEKINEEYLFDKTLNYFKKQSLKNSAENIQTLVELDKIDEAEKELRKYKEVVKDSSNWVNPFAEDVVKKFFVDEQDYSHVLFKLPGAVGNLIGRFERNWLFAVMAPAKKGKTFWLQEIAIQGLLEKMRVLVVSLEMNSHRMLKRIYKRITAFGDKPDSFVYPVFDCIRNQDGSCKKIQRINKNPLLDAKGEKPKEYNPNIKYNVCTACRGTRDFKVGTWFTLMTRPKMTLRNSLKQLKGINSSYGSNLRFRSFPAFSANISTINSLLEDLELYENFIPDMIVIDYADILAPEDSRVTGRDRIDDTWKTLKNLSDTRHCLVVTASQTNRASFKKKNVTQIDISEDIRKIAHIDGGITLNQLPEEKRAGVVRVAMIAGRDTGFDEYKTCIVLQQLEVGQVNLDSEITYLSKTEKSEEEDE